MFFENIKNLDPVYSTKHGKGTIVSVQWRRDNQLLMCYFKSLTSLLAFSCQIFQDTQLQKMI